MRSRRLLALALLALVLALPHAQAGTEASPEIRDPRGDTDGSVASDLLAAWLQATPQGLRVHVKAADVAPDHVHVLLFYLDGRAYAAALGQDGRGALQGHVGPADDKWERGGWEATANDRMQSLALSRSTSGPAEFRGTIPWSAVPGLQQGATLTRISARADFYNRETATWFTGVDQATATRAFVAGEPLPGATPLPEEGAAFHAPAWLPILGATLAGALLGLLVLHRTRRLSPSAGPGRMPTAAQNPQAEPEAADAPKLRLDPRH